MGLSILASKLKSRAIRKKSTGNKVRKFISKAGLKEKKEKGFLSKLWDGFASFSVSLLKGIWDVLAVGTKWTVSAITTVIFATKDFIYNFNFNPSDAQLDADISRGATALIGSLGSLLGKATGYLVCGALPGTVVLAFNEAMGVHVLQELGEEALEEFTGDIASLIRLTIQQLGNATFAFLHKNVRRLWRGELDSEFRKRLEKGGLNKKYIDIAIKERNKPFMLREKADKKVDSIKSKNKKEFVQNFLEELDSSCMEAGYIIANSIDSFIAQQSVSKEATTGKSQNIQVEIDQNGEVKLQEYKSAFA